MLEDKPDQVESGLPVCVKCGKTTEKGHLMTQLTAAMWYGPKTRRFQKKQASVTAYRCPKCGYVELWAPLVI